MKIRTITFSAVLVAIASGGFFLLKRDINPSTASIPYYRSTSDEMKSKGARFTDLKCLAPMPQGIGKIANTSIIRDQSLTTPKGVPYRDVLVAVEISHGSKSAYFMQAIDYRKGECSSYFTLYEDDEESNPLHRVFGKDDAREAQFLWDKWQFDNIPGWRKSKQDYLNGKKVFLSDEDVWSLKKLGFKMPKKWKEIK